MTAKSTSLENTSTALSQSKTQNSKGMTPVEIAYFKHFMYDKDLTRNFLYYFRKNPVKGSPNGDKDANPTSIEQFFLQTPAKDVILKAFTFYTSGTALREGSTFDYWKNIDDQWQAYMRSMADNVINDSWPSLRKTFSILRHNWDIPAYWRKENFESTEEVYKRMHIDMPLPEFRWEHGWQPRQRDDAELIKFGIFDAKDGDVIVRIKKCESGHILRTIILFHKLEPYETDGLQGYKIMTDAHYVFEKERGRLRIGGDKNLIPIKPDDKDVTFRLAFEGEHNILMRKLADAGLRWDETEKALIPLAEEKEEEPQPLVDFAEEEADDPLADFDFFDDVLPGQYRLKSNEISVNFYKGNKITFNQIDSKVIRESELKFVRLAKSKMNDICLIINRQKGATVTNLSGRQGNMNATINSVDICGKLRTLFSLKSDYSILKVEKIQATQEFIIYKITKQQ
jgi:hypothetical protein